MSKYRPSFESVLDIEGKAVLSLKESMDMKAVDAVIDHLLTVKERGVKVITAGCGTSGAAAKKIAHTLSVVEVPSFFLSPADSIHGGMGAIQKGDVVILISKGGNTPELCNYIPVCREKGASIIAVTERPESRLGEAADFLLTVKVEREAEPWNMIASASTLAVIAVFDAIALTIKAFGGFAWEDFLLTHPGGAVLELTEEQKRGGK